MTTFLRRLSRLAGTAAILAFAVPVGAANGPAPPGETAAIDEDLDFNELSLEELMNLEITVASRSPQKLQDAAAAVYVLTGDEIRRAGHSSVQEALRMVPGFYVSHWTNAQWDVTARGFGNGTALTNLAFLNQLLVMIDGVVVYTPLFPGVWWALQDIDLADVDRIEIIRGPGGIIWGSNAVHGVVHIITKNAADTQGIRATFRSGVDDWHGTLRYGGELGEKAHFRVWGKTSTYGTPHNPYLGFSQDYSIRSGGFRADWTDRSGRVFNVWARAYNAGLRNIGFDLMTFTPYSAIDGKIGGQAYWSLANPEKESRWQAWYSLDRQDIETLADIEIESVDLEYQRKFHPFERHTLDVGVGFRRIDSTIRGDDPFFYAFTPEDQVQNNSRLFATDSISFPDQNAEVVVGVQVEHNEFTGFEVQPSVRGTIRPGGKTVLWGAVSRAVRTPSLEEVSLSPDSAIVGNPNFKSEQLTAYELGVRRQLGERTSADLALFYNCYDDLRLNVVDSMSFQNVATNQGEGFAYGAELALDVKPTDRWSLRGAYSFLHEDLTSKIDGSDLGTDDRSPRHLINLRSYYDLAEDWELDAAVYVVEGMGPALQIAEYVRTDLRIGWNPSEELRVAVGVQSANEATHSEFDEFDNIRRNTYVTVQWTP